MHALVLALGVLMAAADGTPAPRYAVESAPPKDAFGPFFEGEPPSETAHVAALQPADRPFLSIRRGGFCFIEDAACRVALLATGEAAGGVIAPSGQLGPMIPYAHVGVRGGFTVRPLTLASGRFHPWMVGAVASWSQGTGSATTTAKAGGVSETPSTRSVRVAMLHQLWLSRRRNALHLDFALGAVRSEVLTTRETGWGTHAEFAVGWGGWGSIYAGGDFLENDTRFVLGFRMHAIAAAPLAGLVAAGMWAGGAL